MSQSSRHQTDRLRADGRRALEKVKGIAWNGFSAAVESYYWAKGTPKLPDDDQYSTLRLPPPGIDCPLCSRCLSLLSYSVTRFGDGSDSMALKITHGRFSTECKICSKASEMWDLAQAHGRFHNDYKDVDRGRWTWQWHLDSTYINPSPDKTASMRSRTVLSIKFEACYLQFSFTIGSLVIWPARVLEDAVQQEHRSLAHKLIVPLKDDRQNLFDYIGKDGINVEAMLDWIRECTTSHPRCRHLSDWRPDRLVAYDAQDGLFRIVRRNHEPDQQYFQKSKVYLSLSHCWGIGDHLNLTIANFADWCQRIPLDLLPATLQDALGVMTHLGTSLMWIDSLCIVQDSKEDWLAQSATMADVYKNVLCNLAIASATSDHEGFAKFRDRANEFGFTLRIAEVLDRQPGKTQMVPTWAGESQQVCVLLEGESDFVWHQAEYPNNKMERHSLFTRGWVFQERELPRRTIGITDRGSFFSCDTKRQDEHSAHSSTLSNLRKVQQQNFESAWAVYVRKYTECKLTRYTDRLIAFSAIAKELAPFGGRYLAGLWEKNLLGHLAWRVVPDRAAAAVPYMAPSWTWASVVAQVDATHPDCRIPLASIVDAQVFPVTDFVYGSVKGGFVRIRGKVHTLKDIRAERRTDHSIRGYPLLQVTDVPMTLEFRKDTTGSVYADQVRCFPICASTACPRGFLLTTYLIIQEVKGSKTSTGNTYQRVGLGRAMISCHILGATRRDKDGVTGNAVLRDESFDIEIVLV